MKMKKLLVCLITLAMLTTAITACKTSGGASTGESKSTSAVSTASTEKVTIKMFMGIWQEFTANIDRLLATYKTVKPNVTIEYFGDDESLQAQLASNTYPDIFVNGVWGTGKPYLEYLSDVSKTTALKDISLDNFDCITDDAGRICGYPLTVETYGILYNKDYFKQVGFNEPPKTYNEFVKLCEALKKANITPIGLNFGTDWINWHFLTYPFGSSKTFKADSKSILAGKLNLKDTDYFKNYKRFADSAIKYSQGKVLESDYNSQAGMFANGEVAMITNGDWENGMITEINPKINMGLMGVPWSDNESEYALYCDSCVMISSFKDAKYNKEGLDFCDWLITSAEGKKWLGQDLCAVSSVKDVKSKLNTLGQCGADAIAGGYSAMWGYDYMPGEGFDSVVVNFQNYVMGSTDWNTMLDKIQKDILSFVK